MNGADQGKLVVYIKDTTSGALNKVWERTGDQGKIWHETSVSLISSSSYEVNTAKLNCVCVCVCGGGGGGWSNVLR